MALIDYYAIQEALQTILVAGPAAGYATQPDNVFIEAMDRETVFESMPLINIRLIEGEMEVRSIPNGYYLLLSFEIDVVCFDLSEFRLAANQRDDIMGDAQLAIQENAQFHSSLSTSTISPSIRFGAGTPEGAGGHIAIGTFTVTAEAYIDATA